MSTLTEKTDVSNARAVRVYEKVTNGSDRKQKKPYLYGILRRTGHGMDFS